MNNIADERFVFIDTETGGIIPSKHSLLSVGLVVWEKHLGIIDKKEVFIKSKRYVVTEKAKSINKFDRKAHNKVSIEPKEAINEIINFSQKYFDKNTAIPLIGHNVQFDINFLKQFFNKNNRSYNQYFSHRAIDTYSVFKTLTLAGKISSNINSSADAFKYFNIKVNERHSALGDCIATVQLYEKLIDLIK